MWTALPGQVFIGPSSGVSFLSGKHGTNYSAGSAILYYGKGFLMGASTYIGAGDMDGVMAALRFEGGIRESISDRWAFSGIAATGGVITEYGSGFGMGVGLFPDVMISGGKNIRFGVENAFIFTEDDTTLAFFSVRMAFMFNASSKKSNGSESSRRNGRKDYSQGGQR